MPPKNKTILIITEKPQAAAKIADALSGGKDDKLTSKQKVSYYEFNKDGKIILIGCAVGHLFGVQQIAARGPFPNFEIEWQPAYQKKRSAFTKKYLDTLKTLAKRADEFIVATDYDVEGEVIGWNVVRFVAGKTKDKKAKRMKFSSLTKDEINNAFDNPEPTINWGEAYAGETRHFLDWYYGINLSRGLMKALTKSGQFRILSIGRVQGPSLKLIYDREIEIEKFKPEPFWNTFLQVRDFNNQKLEVKYPKNITKESELIKFQHLRGKKGTATTTIKDEELKQPTPFDLTTLQTESYKNYGYTPSQTLAIAQSLYLEGIISYPRTSSQEYPESIGYESILKKLKKYTALGKYAANLKPTQGKKKDPAHPAIYPTGEVKKLADREKKVYDLIVKRFISCFCKPALVEAKRCVVEVNGLKFSANGRTIKEKHWLAVYPNKIKDEMIPTLEGEVEVLEIRIEEKQTKPPARYNPSSLVRELEKRNLGTKATRANIIETLYNRGYIKEKAIEITPLGKNVTKTLHKYSPEILEETLTREFEEEMEKVSKSKKDWDKKEQTILKKAQTSINKIASGISENLEKIGESLGEGTKEVYEQERKDNTLTKCPVCNEGNLRIMYGKRYKRYFVSCDAYPKCKTTFTLPPSPMIKPSKDKEGEFELCQECNFPLLLSFKKGRRPWKFCFNPECPSRKEQEENKEKIKAEMQKKNGEEKEETTS
jgi:DNA topoisomerase-1